MKGAEYEDAGGDVGNKHPVSSSQIHRQSMGQFSDRFSGKSLGQIPGRMSGQYVDQDAVKRDGWAIQPNFLPGRATGKFLKHKGGLGFHRQNKLGFNSGPTPITTGTKAIFQKKSGPPVNPAQALSFPLNAEAEGGLNNDVERHGEEAAEMNHSQLQVESQRIETPLVDPDLLNRFEISMPIENSPSLFFRPTPFSKGFFRSRGLTCYRRGGGLRKLFQ